MTKYRSCVHDHNQQEITARDYVCQTERGLVIKKGDTVLEHVLKGFTDFLVRYEKHIVYGGIYRNKIKMISLIEAEISWDDEITVSACR